MKSMKNKEQSRIQCVCVYSIFISAYNYFTATNRHKLIGVFPDLRSRSGDPTRKVEKIAFINVLYFIYLCIFTCLEIFCCKPFRLFLLSFHDQPETQCLP